MRIIEKTWGREEWIVQTELYWLKRLYLKPGARSSLHYHAEKDETFLIESGWCHLEHNGVVRRMIPGDTLRIRPYDMHRFTLPPDALSECCIMEVSTPHDENDVVRIEVSYAPQ